MNFSNFFTREVIHDLPDHWRIYPHVSHQLYAKICQRESLLWQAEILPEVEHSLMSSLQVGKGVQVY